MKTERSKIVSWLTEEELLKLKAILSKTLKDSQTTKIFLVDRFGKEIVSVIDNDRLELEKEGKFLERKQTQESIAKQGYFVTTGYNPFDENNNQHVSIVACYFILIITWWYCGSSSWGLIRATLRKDEAFLEVELNSITEKLTKYKTTNDSLSQCLMAVTDEDADKLILSFYY